MKYWSSPCNTATYVHAATTNMVAEFCQELGFEVVSWPSASKQVKHVGIWDDVATGEATCPENLILCSCDALCSIADDEARLLCIVLDEGETLTDVQGYPMERCVSGSMVLRQGAVRFGERALALEIGNFLVSVAEFAGSLALAVSSTGLCQALVNIAEDFFGCFISVVDANMVLLGYSRHIEPQDHVNKALLANRFHSRAHTSVGVHDYVADAMTQEGFAVFPAGEGFPYALVTCAIRIDGTFAGYAVMGVDEATLTPGSVDAFGIFTYYLQKVMERRMDIRGRGEGLRQNLLFHLIVDEHLDGAFVYEQACTLDVPTGGYFVVMSVRWETKKEDSLARYAEELNRDKNVCLALRYGDAVAVLFHADGGDEVVQSIRATLGMLPLTSARSVYLSDIYHDITETYAAYRSFLSIERYRSYLKLYREVVEGMRLVIAFRDVFCFYWSDPNADVAIREFSARHMLLRKIMADDEENNTDNFNVMMQYLINDRRVSLVAQTCHLHRNGVLYRIKKISARYNLDFEDYLLRQYIQVSARVKMTLENRGLENEPAFPIKSLTVIRPEQLSQDV